MKKVYETYENISLYDIDGVEYKIDRVHYNKCFNDLMGAIDMRSLDHGQKLLVKDIFRIGYMAAHIDIIPDDLGRGKNGGHDHYSHPFFRDDPTYKDRHEQES